MTELKTSIEYSPGLAAWLGVDEVALVREDLLPDGGGKKRRALAQFVDGLGEIEHIHLLSYAGSHTAYTLSRLLPEVMIHLYGTHSHGGGYEQKMISLLDETDNISQRIGSSLSMTMAFNRHRRTSKRGHYFMRIGGSLGEDIPTKHAIKDTIDTIGKDFHHVVAVASGDLLTSISNQTSTVTGVLTQPLAIRTLKYFKLKMASGLWKATLDQRIKTIREVEELTGQTWDPIFMGTLFAYLKRQRELPSKLCIWVTCPSGVDW